MNNMKTAQEPSGSSAKKLRVYFDGLCVLCSREIAHYQRQKGSEAIDFVDICGPDFDAQLENLDPHQLHRIMHARRPDGSLATRVQAFIEIWDRLPRYRTLSRIAKWTPVNKALELGYSCFARVRPLLPRKKNLDCSTSPYCDLRDAQGRTQ